MIMIQKPTIIILLTLICIVNGNGNYPSSSSTSNCKQYENKVYQLTVTFPDKEPFSAALRLQRDGAFDELFSIENGHNKAELGMDVALSNRIGYYKCLSGSRMRLTGLGYLYKTDDVEYLKKNGALVIHDYYFKFSNNGKSCTGAVKFAVFKIGTNPFTTKDEPLAEKAGKVKCELLKYRSYFDLSDL